MNKTYKSLVNWYYIEDWSDYPGPKGRVVPDAEGYDNPSDYDGTELYISQGTIGDKEGNLFIDDEGNDVPFEDQYFEKTNSLKENKMNKELLHMQMLAGIITEGEYKAKLNEYDDFDTESSSVFFDQLANKLKTFLKNEINLSDLEIDGVKIPEEETLEDAVNGMMEVLGVVMKGKAYTVGEKDVAPGYLDKFK